MATKNNFAVLILTHGRPDNVLTYRQIRKQGYTGRIVVVIDNEDKTASEYRKRYKDEVYMFNKAEVAKTFDEGDNFNDRRAIIYARNASFDIAKELGIDYFVQLDDDYTGFYHYMDKDGKFNTGIPIANLDYVFDAMVELFKSTPVASISMAQGGDFIGGPNSPYTYKTKRKAMNSFICSPNRRFQFVGRINEDVNTYTNVASRGAIFFMLPQVVLIQKQTQNNKGGMTELYLDSGTYVKSFYTIMYSPSSVKIGLMGSKHPRLHHKVNWQCAVPYIIPEDCRND